MPTDAARDRDDPPPLARLRYSRIVEGLFAVFVFLGMVSLVEPSPYDYASFIVIPAWLLGGFSINRTLFIFMALILFYYACGLVALVPYLDERLPVLYMEQTFYLIVTVCFFAIFFSENTRARIDLCLRAYGASTVVCALCGIIGFFDVFGTHDLFTVWDRAAGTFKDPNAFGSYLVPGALYFLRIVVVDRARRPLFSAGLLVVVLAGLLLSFSRGAWGATIAGSAIVIAFGFVTTDSVRTRARIILLTLVAIALVALLVAMILSIDGVGEFFTRRANALNSYDEGEAGRFGNQFRSIPLLLDRPLGFGPLRFRNFFGLEPHSSFVNAFASFGWIGGLAFYLLIALTVRIGWRIAMTRSAWQPNAQVVVAAMLVYFVQGFQIDIDHWRQVFLMLGAIWGMEAARARVADHFSRASPFAASPAT
jgi:hypothetical protein